MAGFIDRTPLATRFGRCASFFVAAWLFCAGSIVAAATGAAADGALALALVPGELYLQSHLALREFARLAALPTWVVLSTYAALAGVVALLSVALLDFYGHSNESVLAPALVAVAESLTTRDGLLSTGITLYFVVGVIGVLAVVLPPVGAFLRGVGQLLVGAGPQGVILSIYLLVTSFLTAMVP